MPTCALLYQLLWSPVAQCSTVPAVISIKRVNTDHKLNQFIQNNNMKSTIIDSNQAVMSGDKAGFKFIYVTMGYDCVKKKNTEPPGNWTETQPWWLVLNYFPFTTQNWLTNQNWLSHKTLTVTWFDFLLLLSLISSYSWKFVPTKEIGIVVVSGVKLHASNEICHGLSWEDSKGACMWLCKKAFLRNGGGLLGARQSMLHPLQPHVKLKSVPLFVCVNDPGGTPAPAALHTFPSTCLLCQGCGPVREDYSEECSQAHLLKQERRGGHGHKVYVHWSFVKIQKKCKCNKPRGTNLQLSQRNR